MDTVLEKYKILNGNNLLTDFPIPYLFLPVESDYNQRFLRRYFVKKINDNDIIEVSNINFKGISSKIYFMASIKWRISGKKYSIVENGITTFEGVYEFNQKQVQLAEKTIPEISKRITNYLEGYKG